MNQPFAPRSTDFPPIPRDDSVLILTHLPCTDGSNIAASRRTAMHIGGVTQACRANDIPLIFHNESWRPGHPEIRICRNGYALGSAKFLGVRGGGISLSEEPGGLPCSMSFSQSPDETNS
jgi:hypothetical protein